MQKGKFSLLVIGAGRGGTSLLAGLLDYHSLLELGFEAFSQSFLMGKAIETPPHTLFDDRTQAFMRACQHEASLYPDKFWGNKITTEQLFGLEDHNLANPESKVDVLTAFFNDYLSGIKVIFVLRDGRTCVRSKIARTGQALELACQRWQYSVKVFDFLQKRDSKTTLCLRYEDILTEPEAVMREVCKFLSIEFEDAILRGTGNPKMLPDYQQPTINTSNLGLQGVPDGCLELIRDDLIHCGYH